MNDQIAHFREWCGDEQFFRFVETLESTCRQKRRLVYWQEELLAAYANESGSALPSHFDQLQEIFSDILDAEGRAVSPIYFAASGMESPERVRRDLIDWSAMRQLEGRNRDISLEVAADSSLHAEAAGALKQMLLDDPQVNAAFVGATVSVRIHPSTLAGPSTGMTIYVDDRNTRGDGLSVCLQWTIARREMKRPWWKIW